LDRPERYRTGLVDALELELKLSNTAQSVDYEQIKDLSTHDQTELILCVVAATVAALARSSDQSGTATLDRTIQSLRSANVSRNANHQELEIQVLSRELLRKMADKLEAFRNCADEPPDH
jgi:hypothetical protein